MTTRSLERAAGLNRNLTEEADRMQCMERILGYYAPNLSLDVNSLHKAVNDLAQQHREGPVQDTHIDHELELEDLAIDDEDFTIQALPDNTTRKSIMQLSRVPRGTAELNYLQDIPVNIPTSTSR